MQRAGSATANVLNVSGVAAKINKLVVKTDSRISRETRDKEDDSVWHDPPARDIGTVEIEYTTLNNAVQDKTDLVTITTLPVIRKQSKHVSYRQHSGVRRCRHSGPEG